MKDKVYTWIAVVLFFSPFFFWIVATIWSEELGLYPAIGGDDAPVCVDSLGRC